MRIAAAKEMALVLTHNAGPRLGSGLSWIPDERLLFVNARGPAIGILSFRVGRALEMFLIAAFNTSKPLPFQPIRASENYGCASIYSSTPVEVQSLGPTPVPRPSPCHTAAPCVSRSWGRRHAGEKGRVQKSFELTAMCLMWWTPLARGATCRRQRDPSSASRAVQAAKPARVLG